MSGQTLIIIGIVIIVVGLLVMMLADIYRRILVVGMLVGCLVFTTGGVFAGIGVYRVSAGFEGIVISKNYEAEVILDALIDDEDFIIVVEQVEDGNKLTRTFYIEEFSYNSLEVGDSCKVLNYRHKMKDNLEVYKEKDRVKLV